MGQNRVSFDTNVSDLTRTSCSINELECVKLDTIVALLCQD